MENYEIQKKTSRMLQNADGAAVEMAPLRWWADAESSTISAPITQPKRGNKLPAHCERDFVRDGR